MVRSIHDQSGDYYVLEDAEHNRVALEPPADAAPYAGRRVTVAGRFELREGVGRVIRMSTIAASGASP